MKALILYWQIVYLELPTKNADTKNYSYSGYGIRFAAGVTFSLPKVNLVKVSILV